MEGKKPVRKKPPDSTSKKRSEQTEIALRIEEVFRIRVDGAQYHDVLQYAAEKGWGVTERQIRTYISRADGLMVERLDRKRRRVIARHLIQRQALFARAVNAADYRTALSILDSEAKLRGIYPEKDLREMVKLAAEQGQRIAQLETRRNAEHSNETTPSTPTAAPPAR